MENDGDDKDDQFRCLIMNDRNDLVGKISTLIPTLTSLQCHSLNIPIVPGMRRMALEWGEGYDCSAI